MFSTPSRSRKRQETTLSESERLQQLLGLDPHLPERLVRRVDGRPYLPTQLATTQRENNPDVLQEMRLLLQRHHVGGWESIVEANRSALLEEALTALERRMSSQDTGGTQIPRLLRELVEGVTRTQTLLRSQVQQVDTRLTDVNTLLQRWQETQEGGKQNWTRVLQALLGGRFSFNEAVTLWNERERVAMSRDAHHAALDVINHVVDAVDRVQSALEQTLAEANATIDEVQERVQHLEEANAPRLFDYQVDVVLVADHLCRNRDESRHLTTLFAALREGDKTQLLTSARTIAASEAARLVSTLDIVSALELEGVAYAQKLQRSEAVDTVLWVGENLLDQMRRKHPSWQLVNGAKARVETLQILPDGEPLFDHPELKSAAFIEQHERMAFLEVGLEVAVEEIRLLQEWSKAFDGARTTREYYVLEDLIAHETVSPAPAPPTVDSPVVPSVSSISLNGTHSDWKEIPHP